MITSDRTPTNKTRLRHNGGESSVVAFEGYPDLMTVDNTAEVLQQSAQTVRGLCRKHELPSIRIGRRLYIPKVKLISYVESQLMEA